jgi:hypothetical protein
VKAKIPRYRDLAQFSWYQYAIKGFTEKLKANYPRTCAYYGKMLQATPVWADRMWVLDIYLVAALRRKQGEDIETDHLVPICHPHVCGLHCPDNLMNVSKSHNQRKSNNWWPDMWAEQFELFTEQK